MKLFIHLFPVILVACSGSPVAPKLLDSESSGADVMVYACNNVSKNQIIPDYITNYYLSTWRSAYVEGAISAAKISNSVSAGSTLLSLMPPEKTYCMVYPDNYEDVVSAASEVARSLGIQMVKNSTKTGEFETNYIIRQHDQNLIKTNTKWKVRYLIYVSENIVDGTDIRVFRDLSISRDNKNGKPNFITATSDGHNEAWYLLQVLGNLKK